MCDESKYETAMIIVPMFHRFGLYYMLLGGLWLGNVIVSLPAFKPESFLNAIQQYKVSLQALTKRLIPI